MVRSLPRRHNPGTNSGAAPRRRAGRISPFRVPYCFPAAKRCVRVVRTTWQAGGYSGLRTGEGGVEGYGERGRVAPRNHQNSYSVRRACINSRENAITDLRGALAVNQWTPRGSKLTTAENDRDGPFDVSCSHLFPGHGTTVFDGPLAVPGCISFGLLPFTSESSERAENSDA